MFRACGEKKNEINGKTCPVEQKKMYRKLETSRDYRERRKKPQ